MHNKSEILQLTGLRFIAALYVFLFHIEIRWPYAPDGILKKIISQGAIGMTIFFVLSGFLLAYQYVDRYDDKKSYFLRRFARIYPVYIVAALMTLPWMFGVGGVKQEVSFGETILLVLANIFVVQAWVPSYFKFWNDSGSWSISVEVFCYIVLPFVSPWIGRLKDKNFWFFVFFLYLLTIIPGRLYKVWPDLSFPFLYALPAFRLPEFLLGVCGFYALRRGLKLPKPDLFILVIIVMLIVLLNIAKARVSFIGLNWFVVPLVVLSVLALKQSTGFFSRLLSNDIFVWLGKVSYCFYSLQAFLLFMMITFHDGLIRSIPLLGNNWVLCASSLFVLILLSAFAFHFIEEPCRRKIQAWADGKRKKDLSDSEVSTA